MVRLSNGDKAIINMDKGNDCKSNNSWDINTSSININFVVNIFVAFTNNT